jgi:hypothetical protein
MFGNEKDKKQINRLTRYKPIAGVGTIVTISRLQERGLQIYIHG